jgi:hypothetical protein
MAAVAGVRSSGFAVLLAFAGVCGSAPPDTTIEHDNAGFPTDGRADQEPSVYDPRLLPGRPVDPERLAMHGAVAAVQRQDGLFLAGGRPAGSTSGATVDFEFRPMPHPGYTADRSSLKCASGRDRRDSGGRP